MEDQQGGYAQYNVDNPEQMHYLVKTGLIWGASEYVQRGVDYVVKGNISLAECENMPENIRRLIGGPNATS